MLVLSRRLNESIIIDNKIKITIVDINGNKIKIGIEAPKEIQVHREEVQNAINAEKRPNKKHD